MLVRFIIAALIAGLAPAMAGEPQLIHYLETSAAPRQDFEFVRYWGDRSSNLDRQSLRDIRVYSAEFANADGRTLVLTGLRDRLACGNDTCPVRVFTRQGKLLAALSVCHAFDRHAVSADRKSLIACGVAHEIPQAGPPDSFAEVRSGHFQHGDKEVWLAIYRNGAIEIQYDDGKVRSDMRGETIFRGRIDAGRAVVGTAYVFKKDCPPAPYDVRGNLEADGNRLTLAGPAPIRAANSCEVSGYSSVSKNAILKFVDVGADGDF